VRFRRPADLLQTFDCQQSEQVFFAFAVSYRVGFLHFTHAPWYPVSFHGRVSLFKELKDIAARALKQCRMWAGIASVILSLASSMLSQ